IPWESRVRRSAEAPWQMLEDVDTFADLAPGESAQESAPLAAGSGQRAKAKAAAAADLRTLGMRGLVEELFSAVDSCLQEAKLTAAACTGLGIGVVLMLGDVAISLVPQDLAWTVYSSMAFLI